MVSIAGAERIRSDLVSKSRIRAAETRKRRCEEARSGAAGSGAELTDSLGMILMCVHVSIIPNTSVMISDYYLIS
jgi:hypothetical protein